MKKFLAAIALIGAFVAASPAWAHHSFGMFDGTKLYVWDATVVTYDWRNPHARMTIKVADNAKDKVTRGVWEIECSAPNIMAREGWNKSSLKTGDKIIVVGTPMKDGAKAGALFYAVVNGKRIYRDVNRAGGPNANGKIPPGIVLP